MNVAYVANVYAMIGNAQLIVQIDVVYTVLRASIIVMDVKVSLL
jgi:hypothetical protein